MTRSDSDKLDDLTVVSLAKRQWEKTFDAISDPLMIIDADYVIRRANLALADDLGIAIQRVVGRKCYEVRQQSRQAFPGDRGQPCKGCPVPEARQRVDPRDGDMQSQAGRLYRLRAYPLDDTGAHGAPAPGPAPAPLMVCSYRDVTDERDLTRQLMSAEKLAAIGRLAGGVAHEINNPLGGILAFAQILLREKCTAEEQLEYLHEIEKSAFRCKEIVESLLRFSRQSPRPQQRVPLSLNDVVREALGVAKHKYAVRDVEITCALEQPLPLVLGNANQLEQVLVNLLANAFDAISTRPGPLRGAIEVSTASAETAVEMRVSDSGVGIDEAHLAQIFDPFFTTKEEGKGTGLGLAVSYAIIREHGGRITGRNQPGGGALFAVTLPRAEG
jgi:two-component system, NtrC family, sensor kinase